MTSNEIENAVAEIKKSNANVNSEILNYMLNASLEKVDQSFRCEICHKNPIEICNRHGNICNQCNRKLK